MNMEELFSRTAHGIRPGLGMTEALLDGLGNPHRHLACIHVAGTNGKGSVCAMIESVLRASGFRTGLYTSPHLFRFNERFRINGLPVTDRVVEDLAAAVLDAERRLPECAPRRVATFFEVSTAMAFEAFRREQVDYAVIETGMGGRWDSTNVITPLLSVITRIDLDHAEYLGSDIASIAMEKAGIIKPGVPVVCGPMPVEAEAVLYRAAEKAGSPISGSEETVCVEPLAMRCDGQVVRIEAPDRVLPQVQLPLAGTFQRENCGLAVAALLDIEGIEGVRLKLKEGLQTVRWPGRFELLQENPPVVYDAAHNPSGAEALHQSLNELFPSLETGFLFGFMKDKEVERMVRILRPRCSRAWAITLPGERAMSARCIAEAGRRAGLAVEPVESAEPAVEWLHAAKGRLLCVTGSLFLADELKKSGLYRTG